MTALRLGVLLGKEASEGILSAFAKLSDQTEISFFLELLSDLFWTFTTGLSDCL